MEAEFRALTDNIPDLNGIDLEAFFALPRTDLEALKIQLIQKGNLLKFYDQNKPQTQGKAPVALFPCASAQSQLIPNEV